MFVATPACTGGSTGTPRAPLRLPPEGHCASRGSPPMDYRHKPQGGGNFGRR
jgi:hypothetical protein